MPHFDYVGKFVEQAQLEQPGALQMASHMSLAMGDSNMTCEGSQLPPACSGTSVELADQPRVPLNDSPPTRLAHPLTSFWLDVTPSTCPSSLASPTPHVSTLDVAAPVLNSSSSGSCDHAFIPIGVRRSPYSPCSPSILRHTMGPSSPRPHALGHVVLPLSFSNPTPSNNWESKLVVNLSSANLDPLAFNFLKRGLVFAVTSCAIPFVNFLTDIENVVHSLPVEVVGEVRQDCAMVLYRAKPPNCNISKAEIISFKRLMSNNDIVVSKEDKGNTTKVKSAISSASFDDATK
ncbi:hypothetical protein SUGI_0137580 [Cryptomeria japonica]|nr:hypothetical protein SUGI_0137580 [Cryptomeria japonica]